MDITPEQFDEIFRSLPKELRDAIVSVDTANIINDTGKKYGIHIDQIGELATQTGLVLLGIAHPTEFVANISKKLGIERVVASQIASDINDKIFLKVREVLRGISDKPLREEPEEEQGPRPLRDALLKAIENPENITKKPETKPEEIPLVEIKNPYDQPQPLLGKDVPVVAAVPETQTDTKTPVSSILDQKISGPVSSQSETRKVDPYREQV